MPAIQIDSEINTNSLNISDSDILSEDTNKYKKLSKNPSEVMLSKNISPGLKHGISNGSINVHYIVNVLLSLNMEGKPWSNQI